MAKLAVKAHSKKDLHDTPFSKAVLTVFILFFAGLGGYAIYKSFAAVPTIANFSCSVTQPDLTQRPTGSSQISSQVSNDKTQIQHTDQSLRKLSKATSVQPTAQLVDQIKQRKQHLIRLAYLDPSAAAKQVLKQQTTSKIRGGSDCFEKPVSLQGTVEVRHADTFKSGSENQTADLYLLHIAKQRPIVLHFDPKVAAPISGDKVKVNGFQIDQELIAALGGSDCGKGVCVDGTGTTTTITGPLQTLVIMAYFQGQSAPAMTQAAVNDYVFNQVNGYYQENSYGKTSVVGNSINWLQMSIAPSCDLDTVQQAALAAANANANYLDYSRVMVVAPFPNCNWSGLSSVGEWDTITPDGDNVMGTSLIDTNSLINPSWNLLVFAHEFGHTLGLNHASFEDCGSTSIYADDGNSEGCSSVEYGDPYDIMGGSQPGHLNALHEDYLGWFNSGNIQTVNTSGNYQLEPIESNSNNLKVIRLPRDTTGDYLYIEYHQPVGSDINVSNDGGIFSGALIHADFDGRTSQSYLIDPSPPDNGSNAYLLPGQQFTDPASGDKITINSSNSSGLSLSIQIKKTDFSSPTVTLTGPLDGSTVSGQVPVSATASAASGISKVEFWTGSDITPFATVTTAPYQATWDSTKDVSCSPDALIWAQAYDKAGDPYGVPDNFAASSPAQVTFANGGNCDTTPPSVSFIAPAEGATISGKNVTLTATASDDVAVDYVEFDLYPADKGSFINVVRTVPYTTTFDTTYLPNGPIQISATANDTSGNQNTAIIDLTINNTTKKPGDTNGDGVVGLADLTTVVANYKKAYVADCDFNNDGIVDARDLSILLSHYGT